MRCAEVREALPAHARDGDAGLDVRRHLARCEDCSSELARYGTVVRGLAALRELPVEPPADLFARLTAIPSEESKLDDLRSHVVRNRGRYVGGLAVAAGLAGAALWRSRSRRLVTA